ncbi:MULTISPECIES: TonB-dependent receptor domain-containing protein [unclassified Flavobacterium]|uniref:TonB-dependent receptor domain-containing protein n=1 Tax=unclassified Flavobacterium TaxID=196869 RepID=UPI001F14072E|nr:MULTISPECIES: TonB-dependent receptor [unclassified Flavobacterium]UMY65622.1 TonB-dependent receptor [Flavobacterium sp. HJ-32-4]
MKHCLLLWVLAFALPLSAQKTSSVTGTVTDKTKQPLSYVTISLKLDGKIVTGGITDDNGKFEIPNLEPKAYTVDIQFMGFKTQTQTADLTTQRTVNFTIVLEEDAVVLNDVTVVAERSTIEQKLDRKVINVGRDLTTAGATASEIMGNIPSVNVDQDGKISLRGNENVRILVDGRPTNIDAATLLKQIPSTSIKKIELITNPSAKYNPEGMSGIINIVLHKNANDGFNASLNTGVTVAVTPKINNSLDMNFRTGKVNFFATYGNNFGNQFNDGEVIREDQDNSQEFDIVNKNKSHLLKGGMDFYIDDRNTVSAYTTQNFARGIGYIDSFYGFPNTAENYSSYDIYDSQNDNQIYNTAYKHLFKKEGETLDVELNFNESKELQDITFSPTAASPIAPYNDFKREVRVGKTANVDYVNPLSEKSTLEVGAEARLMRSSNIFRTTGVLIPNAVTSYDFDIYSAYATYGQRFDKFSYQIGARFESYKVKAIYNGNTDFKDDYITVYPSAYLTYTPSEKNSWQMSYSRRVDRPSLEQTTRLPEFSTSRIISVGNPSLDPQFTNSLEVNYTRMLEKGSLTAGVFFRLINDEISRILYPNPSDEENRLIMTFDNFRDNTAFGFELSTNYKLTKWWDVQPAIDFSSIRQRGVVSIRNLTTADFDPTEVTITANAFNARINSNFKATKQLSFLLFGFYRGGVNGVQNDSREMYKVDSGMRYSFLSDKASLSLRFNDMFNTMRYAFDAEHPYPSHGAFYWESRSLFISFNYRFGAGKNRALQRRQRDDNTKQGGGGFF